MFTGRHMASGSVASSGMPLATLSISSAAAELIQQQATLGREECFSLSMCLFGSLCGLLPPCGLGPDRIQLPPLTPSPVLLQHSREQTLRHWQ